MTLFLAQGRWSKKPSRDGGETLISYHVENAWDTVLDEKVDLELGGEFPDDGRSIVEQINNHVGRTTDKVRPYQGWLLYKDAVAEDLTDEVVLQLWEERVDQAAAEAMSFINDNSNMRKGYLAARKDAIGEHKTITIQIAQTELGVVKIVEGAYSVICYQYLFGKGVRVLSFGLDERHYHHDLTLKRWRLMQGDRHDLGVDLLKLKLECEIDLPKEKCDALEAWLAASRTEMKLPDDVEEEEYPAVADGLTDEEVQKRITLANSAYVRNLYLREERMVPLDAFMDKLIAEIVEPALADDPLVTFDAKHDFIRELERKAVFKTAHGTEEELIKLVRAVVVRSETRAGIMLRPACKNAISGAWIAAEWTYGFRQEKIAYRFRDILDDLVAYYQPEGTIKGLFLGNRMSERTDNRFFRHFPAEPDASAHDKLEAYDLLETFLRVRGHSPEEIEEKIRPMD